MSATTDRFSQAVAGAPPEMPLRAQLAACSWCPTEAATSASTAGAQADAPRCGHLSRRLADSWTLYDNTSGLVGIGIGNIVSKPGRRSEEHTSELQSRG